jgi:hypothetical protein
LLTEAGSHKAIFGHIMIAEMMMILKIIYGNAAQQISLSSTTSGTTTFLRKEKKPQDCVIYPISRLIIPIIIIMMSMIENSYLIVR